jgi:hypothetical protein
MIDSFATFVIFLVGFILVGIVYFGTVRKFIKRIFSRK